MGRGIASKTNLFDQIPVDRIMIIWAVYWSNTSILFATLSHGG